MLWWITTAEKQAWKRLNNPDLPEHTILKHLAKARHHNRTRLDWWCARCHSFKVPSKPCTKTSRSHRRIRAALKAIMGPIKATNLTFPQDNLYTLMMVMLAAGLAVNTDEAPQQVLKHVPVLAMQARAQRGAQHRNKEKVFRLSSRRLISPAHLRHALHEEYEYLDGPDNGYLQPTGGFDPRLEEKPGFCPAGSRLLPHNRSAAEVQMDLGARIAAHIPGFYVKKSIRPGRLAK